jgi:hypothetical protein
VLLAGCVLAAGCGSTQRSPAQPPPFSFLGQVSVPHGYLFDGTTVGGLSAISYDPGRQVYYIISDDRSAKNPARFYTVRITFPDNKLDSVEWVATTPLLGRNGAPFAPLSPPGIPPDPEGIAFDERRQQLYWSSEGERNIEDPADPLLLDPWVRTAGLDGGYRGQFTPPPEWTISAQETGPRKNMVLEGLTLTPSGTYIFAGMEDPGYNDGPLPTAGTGALTRITRFDATTGAATGQYAYPLDPIAAPNGDANGLTDVVALDDENFLTIERSYGSGVVAARIYRASITGADNILGRPSLIGIPPAAMTKTLVVGLSTMPEVRDLDNVEGITLGPKLSDGRQSVVLVTDDNFSPEQATQFLAFAM